MSTSETVALTRRAELAADTWRFGLIAVIAFLTLVDLFATQAILPSLTIKYGVSPSTMGVAVNASTFGMAVSGLAIAFFGRDIDRRNGIWISLAILAVPTSLLAVTQDIYLFSLLRVCQGLCMAAAFTLTVAYVAEHFSASRATAALSAYVTGNVASNVFGRMLSASVADQLGIPLNFATFATLNLVGAALVFVTLTKKAELMCPGATTTPMRRGSIGAVFRNAQLTASFAIGFFILFVFIGTYTYVNFRLSGGSIALSPMALGVVYLVFLPSLVTTPFAGSIAVRLGPGRGIAVTLAVAIAGLMMCLPEKLPAVLAGLTLIAIGTFLAQAMATGHVSRMAGQDRAAASGIYLSSYYSGGLAGSFVVGQFYERLGWSACVFLLIAVLTLGIIAARGLGRPAQQSR